MSTEELPERHMRSCIHWCTASGVPMLNNVSAWEKPGMRKKMSHDGIEKAGSF